MSAKENNRSLEEERPDVRDGAWKSFAWKLWGNFFSIAGLIVAVFALYLTISENRASRTHNRLSVTPHLQFSSAMRPDVSAIKLENSGSGPAIVQSFELFYDNEPCISWNKLVDKIGLKGQFEFSTITSSKSYKNGFGRIAP